MPTGQPDDPVNVGDEEEDDLVEVDAESDHGNTGGEDATKVPSGRRTRTRGGPHQKRQRTSGAEQQQTTGPTTRAHRARVSEEPYSFQPPPPPQKSLPPAQDLIADMARSMKQLPGITPACRAKKEPSVKSGNWPTKLVSNWHGFGTTLNIADALHMQDTAPITDTALDFHNIGDVSEMSGVVRETSSEVHTLKKEVAALRADYAELQSKFTSVSQQLFERVGAMEKARDTANKEGVLGAPAHGDVASPSKRVDSSPDPGLRDTAASPLAGFRQASRIGPHEEAGPPQQYHREPHHAPASPSPAPATAQPHQPSVPPGRDAVYYQPGTSRPAPPQRPVAPIPPAPRPSAPIYPGFAAGPPYAPPPGMPFYWQGGLPQPAPPPQQSFAPPAFPSMSGAGEGGGEWMRDAGGEAGVAGAATEAFNGGRPKSKYAGVTGGGDVWFAKLLMPAPSNPIRMGLFPSEEEAAKGYKAAAVVVRPQGYRIQRSIDLTLSEQQLLTGCTRQHVASLAERGLWHRWREWRQLMPELPPAPLLHVPHAPTMLPPRTQAQPSSSQATQPPGMGHSRTQCGQQQYLDEHQHYN
ncbi:unnamed protein product [Closterium sp. Naga37s-1]|nr:unnamed protein product [Closterium sp. Naga37s-1]